MWISDFSIRWPIFTLVTMFLVLIFGGVSLMKIPMKLIPEISPLVGVVVLLILELSGRGCREGNKAVRGEPCHAFRDQKNDFDFPGGSNIYFNEIFLDNRGALAMAVLFLFLKISRALSSLELRFPIRLLLPLCLCILLILH
jgi:hypothetical protein